MRILRASTRIPAIAGIVFNFLFSEKLSAQPLRVMLSATYDEVNTGPDKCGPVFPPERQPLPGVRVELEPDIGETRSAVTKQPPAAYVDVEPGMHTLQATIGGQNAKVGFIYLEGKLGQDEQPKTDKGGIKIDFTRGFSHKVDHPEVPWDYWINVHMCTGGGGTPTGTAPKITDLIVPGELVVGVNSDYRLGYFDADGDITHVLLEFEWNDQWIGSTSRNIQAETLNKVTGYFTRTIGCDLRNPKHNRREIHSRFTLYDALNNKSEPYEFFYTCVRTRSAKVLGQATAFDSNNNRVGEVVVNSKYPKIVPKAGGAIRTNCETSDNLEFCRTLPRKAKLNKLFEVKAQVTNLGADTLARVRVSETWSRVISGECQNITPGAGCLITYSGRMVKKK